MTFHWKCSWHTLEFIHRFQIHSRTVCFNLSEPCIDIDLILGRELIFHDKVFLKYFSNRELGPISQGHIWAMYVLPRKCTEMGWVLHLLQRQRQLRKIGVTILWHNFIHVKYGHDLYELSASPSLWLLF